MKKIVLLGAILLGATVASQAAVRFGVGVTIPVTPAPVYSPPPPVVYEAPAPVYQPPVYQPPAVIYAPAPPPVVYVPPPVPRVTIGFGTGWVWGPRYYGHHHRGGWGHYGGGRGYQGGHGGGAWGCR